MPYTFRVDGMDELAGKLDRLGEQASRIASEALYEGAGVVADKVSSAVQGIATEPFRYAKGGRKRKPSPEEKAIVAGAKHGVAKFRKNGVSVQTSVGYSNSGYASLNGKTKPVPLIAASIESGTSFMEKQPFMRKAFSKSEKDAVAVIDSEIQKRIEQLLK